MLKYLQTRRDGQLRSKPQSDNTESTMRVFASGQEAADVDFIKKSVSHVLYEKGGS